MKFDLAAAAALVLGASASARLATEGPVRMDTHGKLAKKALEPRTMDWGDYALTRDWEMTYDKTYWTKYAKTWGSTPLTQVYCTEWHDMCVDYVGALGYHHQMDCIPTQAGPTIRAYCGGRKKNADGSYNNKNPLVDFTKKAMAKTDMHAEIKGNPWSEANCKAYQKSHPKADAVC